MSAQSKDGRWKCACCGHSNPNYRTRCSYCDHEPTAGRRDVDPEGRRYDPERDRKDD